MHVSCILHLTTHDVHSNTYENKKDFSFSSFSVGSCRKDGAQEVPPPFHSHLMHLIRLVLARAYFSRLFFQSNMVYWLFMHVVWIFSVVFLAPFLHFFLHPLSLSLLPFHRSFLPPPLHQVPAGASAGSRSECWPQLYLSCHQPVCWPAINYHRGRTTCFIGWT